MHILFSFSDNRKVWCMYKDNSALTILLDRGIFWISMTVLIFNLFQTYVCKLTVHLSENDSRG